MQKKPTKVKMFKKESIKCKQRRRKTLLMIQMRMMKMRKLCPALQNGLEDMGESDDPEDSMTNLEQVATVQTQIKDNLEVPYLELQKKNIKEKKEKLKELGFDNTQLNQQSFDEESDPDFDLDP